MPAQEETHSEMAKEPKLHLGEFEHLGDRLLSRVIQVARSGIPELLQRVFYLLCLLSMSSSLIA